MPIRQLSLLSCSMSPARLSTGLSTDKSAQELGGTARYGATTRAVPTMNMMRVAYGAAHTDRESPNVRHAGRSPPRPPTRNFARSTLSSDADTTP